MSRHQSEIRQILASCLERQLTVMGLGAGDLTDDFDMRAEGLLDSLAFVQLLADLEERLQRPIDLADVPPEQLMVVGVLCRQIAEGAGVA